MSGVANKGNYTQEQTQETKQVGVKDDRFCLGWRRADILEHFFWTYEVAFWKGKGQKYRITK